MFNIYAVNYPEKREKTTSAEKRIEPKSTKNIREKQILFFAGVKFLTQSLTDNFSIGQ